MHRAEAPKLHGRRQSRLFDCGFEVPTQQIAPVHGASFCVGENEIMRFPIPRPPPGCIQNRPQDSVGIERNAPATGVGLGVVELAFVEAFHDFDLIRMNSLPAQSGDLTDA